MAISKIERRKRIKKSIRRKIFGTADLPRLSVFKSNRGLYAQLIDDIKGHTLVNFSSFQLKKNTINIEISKEVGQKLGEKAKLFGLEKAVFDRNGYPYHGKVKAFAEGVREAGLKF